MRIPKRLMVSPHTFKVKSGRGANEMLDNGEANGHCIPDLGVIRVHTDRPHTVQAVTLLHESLHAVWSVTLLRDMYEDPEQETIITALAVPLLDMLRRNPEMVAFLLADD